MANTKEIQKRMKSIQDTMKITSAMYMISSAKLRSAKQKLENTEPYFYALQSAISRLLRHIPDAKSPEGFVLIQKIMMEGKELSQEIPYDSIVVTEFAEKVMTGK